MSKTSSMFSSYHEAVEYLGSKDDRPYPVRSPRSTRIVRTDEGIGVKYHDTVVVDYTPKGIRLYTGGWYTVTTKARINESLSALPTYDHVYSDRGVWYLGSWGNSKTSRVLFTEGLLIGYDGKVKNAPSKATTAKTLKAIAKKQAMLTKYVKTLRGMLESGTLDIPSGGDCWHCYFADSSGRPMGELTSSDHLMSHLQDQYIVPSLVWYLAKTRGSRAMQHYLTAMWTPGESSASAAVFKDHTVRGLPGIVRRYFKEQLGI